jgi:hypothetical protein
VVTGVGVVVVPIKDGAPEDGTTEDRVSEHGFSEEGTGNTKSGVIEDGVVEVAVTRDGTTKGGIVVAESGDVDEVAENGLACVADGTGWNGKDSGKSNEPSTGSDRLDT